MLTRFLDLSLDKTLQCSSIVSKSQKSLSQNGTFLCVKIVNTFFKPETKTIVELENEVKKNEEMVASKPKLKKISQETSTKRIFENIESPEKGRVCRLIVIYFAQ